MEVMRIYSEVDTNEKLYSVLMSEEEVIRIFARADYAGLTEENSKKLAAERSRLAKELKEQRQRNNMSFGDMTSDPGNSQKLKAANQNSINQANQQASKFREDLINSQKPKTISPIAKETAAQSTTAATSTAAKTKATGFMNQAKGFVSRNKKALGIGAGVAALGTTAAILYNKNKKQDNGN